MSLPFSRYSQLSVENRKLFLLHLYFAIPLGVITPEFHQGFGTKKLENPSAIMLCCFRHVMFMIYV